jgi:hypothetical protein
MIKKPKKYRIKKNLAGKKVQSKASKKHEKAANEPWLLVSSLSSEEIKTIEVIRIYEKRMQIEESLRDLKNTQNGLGLRYCRSFTAARLNVALLIAALAMLILWIFGIAAKNNHLHYSFQTNAEKRKTVLSHFMIGWQVLRRKENTFIKNELQKALNYIIQATVVASWGKISE